MERILLELKSVTLTFRRLSSKIFDTQHRWIGNKLVPNGTDISSYSFGEVKEEITSVTTYIM